MGPKQLQAANLGVWKYGADVARVPWECGRRSQTLVTIASGDRRKAEARKAAAEMTIKTRL